MSYTLYATATNVDVVSTAAETTWLTFSVPANTVGTLGTLHCVIQYDFLNNTGAGDTFTLRVKYGATTMFDDLSVAVVANAARRDGILEFWVAGDGATNSQLLSGSLRLGSVTAATTGTGDIAGTVAMSGSPFGGAAAEDSTAAKTLAVTIQNTTNSINYSVRLLQAFLEII